MPHKSHAHAQAILVGLKFSIDIGIWRVGVEVGCQDLVGIIHKGTHVWLPMVFWLMISIILFSHFNLSIFLSLGKIVTRAEGCFSLSNRGFVLIFRTSAIGRLSYLYYYS